MTRSAELSEAAWARREIQFDADAAGQVVWDVSVDSSIVRAHQHSAGRVLRRARAAIGLG